MAPIRTGDVMLAGRYRRWLAAATRDESSRHCGYLRRSGFRARYYCRSRLGPGTSRIGNTTRQRRVPPEPTPTSENLLETLARYPSTPGATARQQKQHLQIMRDGLEQWRH